MAKFINDLILDNGLNYLKNNGNQLVVCDGQPATFADATTDSPTGNALGEAAVASGDYAIVNGDTSGRKITVPGKTGLAVDADGTGDHIAIIDTVNSDLLLVTTTASQGVTSGGTMSTQAFDEEIADAS